MKPGRGAAKVIALVVYVIVILVAAPQAQQPPQGGIAATPAYSAARVAVAGSPTSAPGVATPVDLLVGRSTVLNVASPIARVSLTVPDIADAMVTAPQQLLIHGKTPGTISLFVWDRAGGITTYEVNVRRDLSQLVEQMKQLFPGEPITVTGSGRDVVISGTVSSKYVVDKAADVAGGYVEKKENVVNLLKQQEGVASNQVLLRVRFAEVSRSALQELGATFVANGFKNDWFGRTTTQQFSAPDFDDSRPGGLTFSDFLNVFLFNSKHNIGAVVRALQSKGLFQSLAEPNLIASNGKEASFLAGGEYPYPVVQPGSGGNSVTILFKEFGVRLSFTPTVLGGDLINLKVRPEVSSLDFSNAIVLQGFRVPALSTRRTDTEVELQDGQTFAIAGLLNNTLNNTMQKIPGIGDIPVLGYLFRSRAYQKNQTELVVMITPQIVRRGSTGASEGLPSLVEPFLEGPSKPLAPPAPFVGSPRYPASQPAPRGGGVRQPDAAAPQQPAPQQPAPQQPAPAAAPAAQPERSSNQGERTAQADRTTAPAQQQATAESAPAAAAETPKPDPKAGKHEAAELKKAAEAQRAADKKAAQEKAEADKKAAIEAAAEGRRKLAEKERQDKLDKERAKREAEVAKKTAEVDRRKQEEAKKHDKAVNDAAARLREAQAAYQAQVDKKKGQ